MRSVSAFLLLGLCPLACVEIDPSYAESQTSTQGDTTTATTGGSASSSDDAGSGSTGPSSGTNVAFVTSSTHTGALGGLAGADAICNERAQAVGLPGTYVAYLSDANEDAVTRLGAANGWVRTDGRVWARDRGALTSGGVTYPLLLDESGTVLGNAVTGIVELVYTGTDGLGIRAAETCASWQDGTSTATGGGGFTDGAASFWVNSALLGCDYAAHLYCLGIDFDEPVELPPPAADARLIFATNGVIAADAGRTAADALCATEATAAARDGTFLALMAEPGETLWDRHDLGGGDWVRADGAEVLRIADGPANWELVLAPVLLDASGLITGIVGFWAGVGGSTEVATLESTCNGWTDPAYPMRPAGLTIYADWLATSSATPCDMALSVVCLEQ